MIVNSYSILMLFMAGLGLALSGVLAGTAFWAAWRIRTGRGQHQASRAEQSVHLARLVAIVCLAILVVGWPLLYAMLNSFVPEIPGAMCIYGVTKVMPGTIALIQGAKPAVIFLLGAWLLLEQVRRRSGRRSRRMGGMLALATVAGLMALAHGVELYYVFNMESLNEVSCCSSYGQAAGSKLQAPSYYLPWMLPTPTRRVVLTVLFFAGIPLLAAWLLMRARSQPSRRWLSALRTSAALLGASVGLGWVSLRELSEVIAPLLMRLPFHHCLYCLVAGGRAPESLLIVGGLGVGLFAAGWAAVLGTALQMDGSERAALGVHRRVCILGGAALLGSVLTLVVALASAQWGGFKGHETCAMDGQELSPGLRVDFVMADGTRPAFCSIQCALNWLARQPGTHPKEAVVRDALTGDPLDSYTAYFVRSKIVTNRANGNDIHAFQYRTDAAEHIRRFGGQEMDDPFEVE